MGTLLEAAKFGWQNPLCARWNSPEQLLNWREAWASAVNRALEEKQQSARVTHLSHAALGLDEQPTAHEGSQARKLEMKQRLLLASALLGDPKLLILDEPTAGLDPKERVRLRELLAEMATNRIILVATHVVSDVETVAREVILLRAGKIVDAAPVPELIEKYAPGQGLEEVYLAVFGEGDGR